MITCASLSSHLLALRSYFCSFEMYAWKITYWLAILFQSIFTRVCRSVAWIYFPAAVLWWRKKKSRSHPSSEKLQGLASLLSLLWLKCVYHHSSVKEPGMQNHLGSILGNKERRCCVIFQCSYVIVWQRCIRNHNQCWQLKNRFIIDE